MREVLIANYVLEQLGNQVVPRRDECGGRLHEHSYLNTRQIFEIHNREKHVR